MQGKDMSAEIMSERLDWAIEMLKDKAKNNNIDFDKDLFVKACEVGISMYIQKEKAFSNKQSKFGNN